jgi:hypothetical protein
MAGLAAICGQLVFAQAPGTRVLLDAHNAYPYDGLFADRIERALSTGTPIAIEQDLVWSRDPATGAGRPVVSHGEPLSGGEPSLEAYFFERIRPVMERALQENRRDAWPIVTLNLDFKTNEPEHHAAVWDILGRYESWLTTAVRPEVASEVAELDYGPLLVLTGEHGAQEASFHDRVPPGGRLRLFGAVHTEAGARPGPRTSYRRWWNNPWSMVEAGGQEAAGDWTPEEDARLRRMVAAAHEQDLWIRFYTLNGHDPADVSGGWTPSYNFGSPEAARRRWNAAIRAGVDFVAVDQYEAFAGVLRAHAPIVLTGTLSRADYERLFEHAFDVPAGTTRIDVELAYDDANRTVIDLGLRDPSGVRGWSGGGRQAIFVAEHSAAYGYTPGPIAAGTWAVVVGVPNIREGVTANYELRITFSGREERWPTLSRAGGWYVGDLHAHSGHSDGRTLTADGTRLRVPPQRVFEAAARAGLDFMALTDHNTPSHWADVDRLQPLYPSLLLLHGREVTTYRGHMNAFGEHRFVDFRPGSGRSVRDVAAALRSEGAFVSVNHPARPDDETCMGCGWNDRDAATMAAVDGVEIVNGDDEYALEGWPFWVEMLNRGHRLVAIGGSDEHTPDEVDDRRVGRPATVIHAEALSEGALLAGLRAGRAYVRVRGAEGPALEFSATGGIEPIEMGDIAPARGRLTLQVRTERAAGQELQWIRRGEIAGTARLGADGRAALVVEPRAGDWFSVVLRDASGPTLFSNPIYIE